MKILGTALIAFALFTMVSCSKKESAEKPAGEIMKDYTKTLSSAPERAREAEKAAEKHDDKTTEAIKELDR